MTRHYAHISDAAKSQAIDALPVLKFSDSANDPEKDALLKKLASLPAEKLIELVNYTNSPLTVENLKAM